MSRSKIVRLMLVGACSLLLLACQMTLLEPEGSTNGEDAASSSPSTSPGVEAASLSALEQSLVQHSIDDLIAELGVAADAVTLMEVEAMEWPDASLGCPQPEMMYAQVITNGYRIVLEADGTTYDYHTDANADGQVVRCEAEE